MDDFDGKRMFDRTLDSGHDRSNDGNNGREDDQTSPKRGMALRVKELEFGYPGNRENTLRGITFHVDRGEIFGFLGPSGAGKSTAQKVLMGIIRGYRGEAAVFGESLAASRAEMYERIGVSFELPNLYLRLTALENLRLFRSLYRGRTRDPEELLALVGLGENAHTRVEAFSKGMKMRLNFCRSLLPEPELLYLDEPTSGLDPGNARVLKDLILEEKRRGTAVFLTTHDMNVAAELCDRVAFLIEGRIAAADSPSRLMREEGERRVVVELRRDGVLDSREFELGALARNGDFLDFLDSGEVERIHTKEANLEQVFLAITGRSLS